MNLPAYDPLLAAELASAWEPLETQRPAGEMACWHSPENDDPARSAPLRSQAAERAALDKDSCEKVRAQPEKVRCLPVSTRVEESVPESYAPE